MSVITLRGLLPEVAMRDARAIRIENDPRIPEAALFAIEEAYCVDLECDCQRVLLMVVEPKARKTHVVVSHSFRPPERDDWHRRYGIYERTFIDPLDPRSEWAEPLFDAVKHLLSSPEYVDLLQGHYRDVRHAIRTPGHPIRERIPKEYHPAAPVEKKPPIGRNAPCPCGSGKKFKKCCGLPTKAGLSR